MDIMFIVVKAHHTRTHFQPNFIDGNPLAIPSA